MTENNAIQPHLKVVSGNPTRQELAVVIAVLQASQANAVTAQNAQKSEPTSGWNRNPGLLRSSLTPGQNQWQASFRSGLN